MKHKPRLNTLSAIIDDFAYAPFRLFFLTAGVAAIIAATFWSLAFWGWWPLSANPIDMHAFWFMQSFAGATYAGFLFTAIPEWAGDPVRLGKQMKRLWLVWLVAVFTVFVSLAWAFVIMQVFWAYLLLQVYILVWQNRDDRQLSVLVLITAIVAMSTWLTVRAWRGELLGYDWQQLLHLLLLGIALFTFRISRAIGTQALEDAGKNDSKFIPNPYYKNLSIWLFYALVLANLTLKNSVIEGWLHLAIGGVMIGRLREFHFIVLLKRHYIRWLYATILLIGVGYGWRGLALIASGKAVLLNPILPMHLIAIGGFLLMAYQVFVIAGLRHSDRDLRYPTVSRLALLCLVLAAASRSLAVVAFPAHYLYFAIYLPNGFVVVAFLLYLPVFYRIFVRYQATVPKAN